MAYQKPQLVDPARRETVPVTYIDLMLLEFQVGGGAGQYGSAHSLVFNCAPFVGITHPELIAIRQVVKYPSRAKEVPGRIGNTLIELKIGPHFGDRKGLLVLLVLVERKQKARVLA